MLEQATKIELRKALLQKRAHLTKEQVQSSSELVTRQLLAYDSPAREAFSKAQCVMGFLAFGKELSVDAILAEALAQGKLVCVPFITSATEFVAVRLCSFDNFALDRYGIRTVQPPLEIIEPQAIDFVLVPGVAFGRDGSRMGMGAGYYDRFLPQLREQTVTVGVAYAALLQEHLPCDEHDQKMQLLVSESGVLTCR